MNPQVSRSAIPQRPDRAEVRSDKNEGNIDEVPLTPQTLQLVELSTAATGSERRRRMVAWPFSESVTSRETPRRLASAMRNLCSFLSAHCGRRPNHGLADGAGKQMQLRRSLPSLVARQWRVATRSCWSATCPHGHRPVGSTSCAIPRALPDAPRPRAGADTTAASSSAAGGAGARCTAARPRRSETTTRDSNAKLAHRRAVQSESHSSQPQRTPSPTPPVDPFTGGRTSWR